MYAHIFDFGVCSILDDFDFLIDSIYMLERPLPNELNLSIEAKRLTGFSWRGTKIVFRTAFPSVQMIFKTTCLQRVIWWLLVENKGMDFSQGQNVSGSLQSWSICAVITPLLILNLPEYIQKVTNMIKSFLPPRQNGLARDRFFGMTTFC